MKTGILFVVWFVVMMLGSLSVQGHEGGLFIFCAIVFPILSIILFFHCLSLLSSKRKYKEIHGLEKDELKDSKTEYITLDHPDYIGILTKIDKKKIAEEYLAEQKKETKR
jgi:Na+/melibiose symporter-like transporter